ncbi:uncharacterized protein BDR25DRAFT_395843 [Lindgomyces ingoldianus]|uniref:Uncharacterized protein n=1 Tax=Lindgomyces ingoldianus TaxID=673940 RepID=A0ACB6QJA4_9PLEO|nr:uncharacterized protein BDR25DRAFT_395843 [Lindgomyces ingoldianus]KAF2466407.1 hypothetical protein BDR25DRAFT_395843 [Lindgomyces ingoldianus]
MSMNPKLWFSRSWLRHLSSCRNHEARASLPLNTRARFPVCTEASKYSYHAFRGDLPDATSIYFSLTFLDRTERQLHVLQNPRSFHPTLSFIHFLNPQQHFPTSYIFHNYSQFSRFPAILQSKLVTSPHSSFFTSVDSFANMALRELGRSLSEKAKSVARAPKKLIRSRSERDLRTGAQPVVDQRNDSSFREEQPASNISSSSQPTTVTTTSPATPDPSAHGRPRPVRVRPLRDEERPPVPPLPVQYKPPRPSHFREHIDATFEYLPNLSQSNQPRRIDEYGNPIPTQPKPSPLQNEIRNSDDDISPDIFEIPSSISEYENVSNENPFTNPPASLKNGDIEAPSLDTEEFLPYEGKGKAPMHAQHLSYQAPLNNLEGQRIPSPKGQELEHQAPSSHQLSPANPESGRSISPKGKEPIYKEPSDPQKLPANPESWGELFPGGKEPMLKEHSGPQTTPANPYRDYDGVRGEEAKALSRGRKFFQDLVRRKTRSKRRLLDDEVEFPGGEALLAQKVETQGYYVPPSPDQRGNDQAESDDSGLPIVPTNLNTHNEDPRSAPGLNGGDDPYLWEILESIVEQCSVPPGVSIDVNFNNFDGATEEPSLSMYSQDWISLPHRDERPQYPQLPHPSLMYESNNSPLAPLNGSSNQGVAIRSRNDKIIQYLKDNPNASLRGYWDRGVRTPAQSYKQSQPSALAQSEYLIVCNPDILDQSEGNQPSPNNPQSPYPYCPGPQTTYALEQHTPNTEASGSYDAEGVQIQYAQSLDLHITHKSNRHIPDAEDSGLSDAESGRVQYPQLPDPEIGGESNYDYPEITPRERGAPSFDYNMCVESSGIPRWQQSNLTDGAAWFSKLASNISRGIDQTSAEQFELWFGSLQHNYPVLDRVAYDFSGIHSGRVMIVSPWSLKPTVNNGRTTRSDRGKFNISISLKLYPVTQVFPPDSLYLVFPSFETCAAMSSDKSTSGPLLSGENSTSYPKHPKVVFTSPSALSAEAITLVENSHGPTKHNISWLSKLCNRKHKDPKPSSDHDVARLVNFHLEVTGHYPLPKISRSKHSSPRVPHFVGETEEMGRKRFPVKSRRADWRRAATTDELVIPGPLLDGDLAGLKTRSAPDVSFWSLKKSVLIVVLGCVRCLGGRPSEKNLGVDKLSLFSSGNLEKSHGAEKYKGNVLPCVAENPLCRNESMFKHRNSLPDNSETGVQSKKYNTLGHAVDQSV